MSGRTFALKSNQARARLQQTTTISLSRPVKAARLPHPIAIDNPMQTAFRTPKAHNWSSTERVCGFTPTIVSIHANLVIDFRRFSKAMKREECAARGVT
jgi:hypothetical protein